MKKIINTIVIFLLTYGQTFSQSKNDEIIQLEKTNNYTFELSQKVLRQKVTFKNRYGITISGDYTSQKIQKMKNFQL